jgi:hypothetical protein
VSSQAPPPGGLITVEQYVELAKAELDRMVERYREEQKADPEHWPELRDLGAWGEEEMIARFG